MTTENIKYVDSVNGNDSNAGSSTSPYQTIVQALVGYKPGVAIVLYTGTYAAVVVANTRLRMISLPGSSPVVDSVTITEGQGSFDGIEITNGISITNTSKYGALNVRKCKITTGTAISCTNVKYVSIHRNEIDTATNGISISTATEVAVSSNIIHGTTTPLQVSGADRADFYHNTVDDATNFTVASPSNPLVDTYDVSYVYVTATIIANKQFPLPVSAISNIALNITNGSSLNNGDDFQVIGSIVDWNGLNLEGVLEEGDILRAIYTSQTVNKVRVDSNSITDVAGSIALTSDYTYNNFNGSTTSGPLNTNFKSNPNYVSPPTDYSLQPGSPNENTANPSRWDDAFLEVAPQGRNIDFNGAHRFYEQGNARDDIGAYELLNNSHTGTDSYVDESGFNVVNDGDVSDPLLSINTAFAAGNDPINIILKPVDPNMSKRRTTIVESSLALSNSALAIHEPQAAVANVDKIDVAYIRSFLEEIPTGTVAYVSELGDDLTADGTTVLPYRTITAALASAAINILVMPGAFELFTGVSGKTVTFLEGVNPYAFSSFANSEVQLTTWGTTTSGGTIGISGKTIDLAHAAPNLTTLLSLYRFNNNLDVTSQASIESNIGIKVKGNFNFTTRASTTILKVSNSNHSAFIEYSEDYIKLGGGTYDSVLGKSIEYANKYPQTNEDGWVDITIRDSIVEVTWKSENYTRVFETTLNDEGGSFPYRENWGITIESSGSSNGASHTTIENLHARADELYSSSSGLTVQYITLSALDVSNQYVLLSNVVTGATSLNLTEGTSQLQDTDYEILDSTKLSWEGLGMASLPLSAGDTIKLIYTSGSIVVGGDNIHKVGRTISGLS